MLVTRSPLAELATPLVCSFFFFFNDTATTEIYTLSLHDALPILMTWRAWPSGDTSGSHCSTFLDRKSTRLNSSHGSISYAVFCLKKKIQHQTATQYLPKARPNWQINTRTAT